MKKYLIPALALAVAPLHAASPPHPSGQSQAEPSQEGVEMKLILAMPIGGEITCNLDGNPTTGYSWSLMEELPADCPISATLEIQPAEQKEGEPPLCGAPSPTKLTVKGVRPGKYTLVLKYSRPWEKDVAPAKTETFEFEVIEAK